MVTPWSTSPLSVPLDFVRSPTPGALSSPLRPAKQETCLIWTRLRSILTRLRRRQGRRAERASSINALETAMSANVVKLRPRAKTLAERLAALELEVAELRAREAARAPRKLPDNFITPQQAAYETGLSEPSIYRLIRKGMIGDAVKIGGRFRINRDTLPKRKPRDRMTVRHYRRTGGCSKHGPALFQQPERFD